MGIATVLLPLAADVAFFAVFGLFVLAMLVLMVIVILWAVRRDRVGRKAWAERRLSGGEAPDPPLGRPR